MVFLYEAVGLRITKLLGFAEVGKAFSLVVLHTLGEAEEEIAVAVLGFDGYALFGCGLCIIEESNANLKRSKVSPSGLGVWPRRYR